MKRQIDSHKTIVFIILINIIQVITMILVLMYLFLSNSYIIKYPEHMILLTLLTFAVVSSCITIFNALPISKLNREISELNNTLTSVENLNLTLRAQRHDFLNQLQVVYSLIELDEYSEAHNYIEKVYEDIQKVSRILKTDHAPINAILQAKVSMCESHQISVKLDIMSRFTDITIPVWQMCRVLGNLFDNAITALDNAADKTQKNITLTLSETLKTYTFKISNNGPSIPPAQWSHIFEAGVTTKKLDGHGMGLTICRSIMNEYDGELKVISDSSETSFIGTFPKQLSSASARIN